MTGALTRGPRSAARTGGLPLLAIRHSEGAWYAAELAADHAVAGAVLLAGGARPAEQIPCWQTEMVAARLPPTARGCLAGQGVLTRGAGLAATQNIPLWHG